MFGLMMVTVSAALLAQADEQNQHYVECIFVVAREAPASMSESELETRLRNSCTAERSALRETTLAIRQQRGDTPAQAQAAWEEAERQGIASILNAHRLKQSLGN